MIRRRSKTIVQLTYTTEEYYEFTHVMAAFRKDVNTVIRNEFLTLHDYEKDYFRTLADELIQLLDYIDRTIIVVEAGFELTLSVQELEKFNGNLACLEMDLIGFQDWYHRRRENEKENALAASQYLAFRIARFLGAILIIDNPPAAESGKSPTLTPAEPTRAFDAGRRPSSPPTLRLVETDPHPVEAIERTACVAPEAMTGTKTT